MQQFRSSSRRQTWLQRIVALLAVLVFGGFGMHFYGSSFAASASYNHNPTAIADYCTLEGSSTVLYGWAHDPDASPPGPNPYVNITVGGSTVTVASSIAGYRDAEINTYFANNSPGEPTSSVYGWRLVVGTVYKGTVKVVSGTVINVGTGVNTALQIDTSHSVDGHIYFNSNGSIPDVCLTNRPSPAPSPSPTPSPTYPPPKSGSPIKVNTTPSANSTSSNTPATTAFSPADATAIAGTTTASLNIPADGASSIYIKYGTDPNNLSVTSDSTVVGSDASVTILLKNLAARTTYNYQISRIFGSQTNTSVSANFITKGYSISLVFTDSKGKPIQGIVAGLNNQKATSDKNGTITFSELAEGSYSPTFSYKGQIYSQDFSTSTAATENGTDGILLSQTVDVSKLSASKTGNSTVKNKSSSIVIGIVISIIILILIGLAIWWWVRRRHSNDLHLVVPPPNLSIVPKPVISQDTSQLPLPPKQILQSIEKTTLHRSSSNSQQPVPPFTPPKHMGESLRDMVIQSMAEEAAKHPENKPRPPIVPGGRQ
jgi:hypothetical protein